MTKVLVIDDDATVRAGIRRVLENAGCDVIEAETGEADLDSFRNDRVDVTIVDIVLPDADGVETIAAMRWHEPDAKIIAISGFIDGDVEALAEAKRQKANVALVKPFTGKVLVDAVRRCLRATITTA